MAYNLENLTQDLIDRNIPYGWSMNNVISIEGFSKSGTAEVYFSKKMGALQCETRYGQVDTINSFQDLVNVAFEWWEKSEFKGYSIPQLWVEAFIEFNLIRKVVKVEYEVI